MISFRPCDKRRNLALLALTSSFVFGFHDSNAQDGSVAPSAVQAAGLRMSHELLRMPPQPSPPIPTHPVSGQQLLQSASPVTDTEENAYRHTAMPGSPPGRFARPDATRPGVTPPSAGSSVVAAPNAIELLRRLNEASKDPGGPPIVRIVTWLRRASELDRPEKGIPDAARQTFIEAVRSHPDWQSPESSVKAAEGQKREAEAGMYPQVAGGVDYGRRGYGKNPLSGANQYAYNATTSQVSLKQLLYDFGATDSAYKSAEDRKMAAEARAAVTRSELLLRALASSIDAQRMEVHRLWLENFLRQREQTTEKITRRFEIGAGTIYDIAKADIKLNEAKNQLREYEAKRRSAKIALAEYGLPEDFFIPTYLGPWVSGERFTSQVHPVIQEALALKNSAMKEVEAGRARTLPRIALELSQTDRQYDSQYSGTKATDTSVLVTLSYNFYTGGADSARITQAAARFDMASNEVDAKTKSVDTLIRRTNEEMQLYQDAFDTRRAALDAANSSYLAAIQLFSLNRGSLVDLQRAEDDLSEKARQLIDHWFDGAQATYRLLHVKNQLLGWLGLSPSGIVVPRVAPGQTVQ